MTITREDAVAEARSWLGTPFQHQGCLKGVACDCIGLVKSVGITLGLVEYDEAKARPFLAYRMMPDSKKMREALATFFVPIRVVEAMPADILFLAWTKEPQHLALITDLGIIHSYSGVGKVVEHSFDERWQKRVTAAYRYPYFVEH
jgi:NlpC/P60 family putative phage cell wall peptidase